MCLCVLCVGLEMHFLRFAFLCDYACVKKHHNNNKYYKNNLLLKPVQDFLKAAINSYQIDGSKLLDLSYIKIKQYHNQTTTINCQCLTNYLLKVLMQGVVTRMLVVQDEFQSVSHNLNPVLYLFLQTWQTFSMHFCRSC